MQKATGIWAVLGTACLVASSGVFAQTVVPSAPFANTATWSQPTPTPLTASQFSGPLVGAFAVTSTPQPIVGGRAQPTSGFRPLSGATGQVSGTHTMPISRTAGLKNRAPLVSACEQKYATPAWHDSSTYGIRERTGSLAFAHEISAAAAPHQLAPRRSGMSWKW